MNKQIIFTAALLGVLAVILGAFGAHGLKAVLEPQQIKIWETGVQYHFYHVFALLFLASFVRFRNNLVFASYCLFVFGILLFSGSLYLLACSSVLGWSWLHYLGPITPIGGVLFIAGWICMAVAALRYR
jgi:uncharacterized membrane protein YgdD (TMEM256/DUF423 family)